MALIKVINYRCKNGIRPKGKIGALRSRTHMYIKGKRRKDWFMTCGSHILIQTTGNDHKRYSQMNKICRLMLLYQILFIYFPFNPLLHLESCYSFQTYDIWFR